MNGFLFRKKGRVSQANRGFSLVEILIVVIILSILAGVTGSIIGGFIANFELTDNHSTARRRAQDVFNILHRPLQNAGLGLPYGDFDYYFRVGGANAAITGWPGPLDVIEDGAVLRVAYSIYSGVKNGREAVEAFSSNKGAGYSVMTGVPIYLTGAPPVGSEGITAGSASGVQDIRSFVTFPGARMNPVLATEIDSASGKLTAVGVLPKFAAAPEDVTERNMIRAFSELFLVRAAAAYVDSGGAFVFFEIADEDPTNKAEGPLYYPSAANVPRGYRVEGIKAVWFKAAADKRKVTVRVIAEGDNQVTGGNNENTESQAFRREWLAAFPDLAFEPGVHYEEFSMEWRTRNLAKS